MRREFGVPVLLAGLLVKQRSRHVACRKAGGAAESHARGQDWRALAAQAASSQITIGITVAMALFTMEGTNTTNLLIRKGRAPAKRAFGESNTSRRGQNRRQAPAFPFLAHQEQEAAQTGLKRQRSHVV
jgi:hypothetical protein